MQLRQLWLSDFRNYTAAELEPAPGLTVLQGENGEGKSNLLEAIGYLATLASFRGAPGDVLVRDGAERAYVRATVDQEGREVLLEAELNRTGRDRVQVNRQPLRRSRDLLGALRVTVFAPDDLALVKGGPAGRRAYLDDILVALHPRNDGLVKDVDRILRQRNALLRSAAGRLHGDAAATLDVWDARLAQAGEALAVARHALASVIEPLVGKAYDDVAHTAADVAVAYRASWRPPGGPGLAAALAAARAEELRRGVTLVGPHRDDLVLTIGGRPSRTHASQGEQRSLALALRLAAHGVVTDTSGTAPVLLLDDVFSELDAGRTAALVEHLPAGQTLLTTAGAVPAGTRPDLVVRVAAGVLAIGHR